MMMADIAVSARTTYLLWFFFGWAGIHHLYLGRLDQAVVWFATLGGGCGIGWVRDYWKIPEYMKWCNPDKTLRKKYLQRATSKPKPESSSFRSTGMVIMGSLTSTALGALVPDYTGMLETDPATYYVLILVYGALRALGNAVGIYLVANIGELKCSFYCPLIASVCSAPLVFMGSPFTVFSSSLPAWYTNSKDMQWRHPIAEPEQGRKGCKKYYKNVCIYLIACLSWLLIVAVGFYQNGSIEKNGEKIMGKELFNATFRSEEWQQMIDGVKRLYDIWNQTGSGAIWSEIKKSLDFTEKIKAYSVLKVFPWTEKEEISKRCRNLLAVNHPDKFTGKSAREAAESQFLVIQRACSILSRSRSQPRSDD